MIQDYKDLIDNLNEKLRIIIGQDFMLKLSTGDGHRLKLFQNNGNETAINRLDGGNDSEVLVHKWFKNYYIYVEVKFIFKQTKLPKAKTYTVIIDQCSISISVFKKIYDTIVQLFRAEWDEYSGQQNLHPQPHWHITSDTSIANTFDEYARQVGDDGFMNIFIPEKEQISSLKKFHFAMKGKWEENKSHSTSIESSEQVSEWMKGLLSSIRVELEYIDK